MIPSDPNRAEPKPSREPSARHRAPRALAARGVLAAALLALALPAAGQPAHGPGEPASIRVTGMGEAAAAPDMATITVGVSTQAATAGEAMAQNATRQQATIDALTDRGVEVRDIQTSNLSLTAVQDYSREGQPPVVTGYQAANMVTIRVRDLPQLGALLDALVGAGANEIQGIAFSREDSAAMEAEARRDAVADARTRAEVIAEAAGQHLGRLVSLSEGGQGAAPPQPMMMRAMADSAAPPPVQPGELSLTAEVTAIWELLPAPGGPGPDAGATAPAVPQPPAQPAN